jgi:predicted RND superfamily exporter protein
MGFREDSFRISGMLVLYNNMLQSLFDSQVKTIGLVFVMIWLMFIILFKSIKIGTIAIIPNIIPALAIIGLMGLLGISLDLMTITIASIAIGIGVDDAIHYISRFKEEFNKTNNYETSMFNSHASIGKAMFYTSITIIIGFSVLILSNFIPSIYFGIFTGIAMLLAVVLNLTLLPKLLVSFKPKFD